MVKKFTDAEKFVGSRRQFSTYFKSVSSRLVTSLKSLLEMVLVTQSRRAFGDFGEGSKPRRTEKEEKKIRTDTWIKLAIKPEEIKLSPNDVLTKLTEENGNLRATVEEKAADLYHKMRQKMAHSGKDFTDVGKKQQYDRSTNFVELEVNVPRTIGTLRDALIGLPGIWKLLWLRRVLKILS